VVKFSSVASAQATEQFEKSTENFNKKGGRKRLSN
jgi:hypothetical protein